MAFKYVSLQWLFHFGSLNGFEVQAFNGCFKLEASIAFCMCKLDIAFKYASLPWLVSFDMTCTSLAMAGKNETTWAKSKVYIQCGAFVLAWLWMEFEVHSAAEFRRLPLQTLIAQKKWKAKLQELTYFFWKCCPSICQTHFSKTRMHFQMHPSDAITNT